MAPADDPDDPADDPDDITYLCPFCKDLLLDPVTLPCCGESFCCGCLRAWVRRRCESANVVRCPNAGCSNKDLSVRLPACTRILKHTVETAEPAKTRLRRQKDAKQIRVGARVELQNLDLEPKYNGTNGIIQAFLEESDSWKVLLEDGAATSLQDNYIKVVDPFWKMKELGFEMWQEVAAAHDLYVGDVLVVAFGTKGVVLDVAAGDRLTIKFDARQNGVGVLKVFSHELVPQLPPHHGLEVGQKVAAAVDLHIGDSCPVKFATRGTIMKASGSDRITVKFDNCDTGYLNVMLDEITTAGPYIGGFKLAQKIRASRDLFANEKLMVRSDTPGTVLGEFEGSRLTVKFDFREDGSDKGITVMPDEISAGGPKVRFEE